MSDVKSNLKDAREAIKNKDYKTSLKLCKSILRQEEDNYMALVFLGLSLQEVGPADQAPKAFKKAIQANATNPLAWNGLARYYEKINTTEAKKELCNIYMSLLSCETAENKLLDYCTKLCNLTEHSDKLAIANSIALAAKKCNGSFLTEIQVILVNILAPIRNLPDDICQAYEESLSALISNQKTLNIEYYSSYLTLLYRQNKIKELLEHAEKMHNLYELDTLSLNWICKIFNEVFVEESDFESDIFVKINDFCNSLLLLDSNAAAACLTKGILLLKENNPLEAKKHIQKATIVQPGLLHAWILLTQCHMDLNFYNDALQSAMKADKLLLSNSNIVLRNKVNIFLIEAKSKLQEEDHLQDALDLYEKMDANGKCKCKVYVIRASIKLGKLAFAKVLMNESDRSDDKTYLLLKAQLLHKEKKLKEALKILESENVESSEWWIEIGSIYWELEEYSQCLIPFLKAAKFDPNNYLPFIHLGHYYQKVNNLDKSRRCYEKAVRLGEKCSEAGVELSKIYRKLKNWEANVSLLESLTTGCINSSNSWAWLQLGLNYLDQGNYSKALEYLRATIRIEHSNGNCWEALADAYLARGAYSSALKCYQKSADLSKNSLYSLLQMANIKQILGEYAEANKDYREILLDNPKYILALKGLSETCLCQAFQCYKDHRLGSSRDYCQQSIDVIFKAIEQQSKLACLWKVAADSCFFVARLPEKWSYLFVPNSLSDVNEGADNKMLEKNEIYSLASKLYCKAINISADNSSIWHDLATCLLSQGLNSKSNGDTNTNSILEKAYAVVQDCLARNSTNWQHWDLLGNIAFHQDPPNYSVAQHAFIKSISLNHNSARSWCNLGTLYLTLDHVKLANEAFSQAQRSDPNYVSSWIGQGIIAERLGHLDAMDLFRHSTQLGAHQQGGLGYGHWVCKTLLESEPGASIYAIHNMHAIPVACDALTWYTEKNPNNSCAWNILGILKERMGLNIGAMEAFKNALFLSDSKTKQLSKINFARSQFQLGNFKKAISIYCDVETATFSSGSGLALALFKDKQYEQSYEAYEAALDWLTDEQSALSELLVALASIAYMFQGPDAAKSLLFQSLQLQPPSPWSLFSTVSLGLLHNDAKLAQLVLNELHGLKDNKECLKHVAKLICFMYVIQGQHKKAIVEISKLIHRHPDQAHLWLTMSTILLRLKKVRPLSPAVTKCAQVAMKLGHTNTDVSKVLCLAALNTFYVGDYQQSLILAQKAIHCYPDNTEAWSILLVIYIEKKSKPTPYLIRIIECIKSLNPSPSLLEWIQIQESNLT